MTRRLSLLLTSLVLSLAASAQPMQTDVAPAAQSLRLSAGAEGSASFDVRAVSASDVADCPGYVDPSAPDVVLEWGGGDLRFWVRAAFDATLLVYGPDGEWTCNDDADGTSPVVEVPSAPAGRYAVWLGSFAPTPDDPTATLYAGTPPPPPVLDPNAPASAGAVAAVGGFEDAQGAIEVSVRAGGADRADALDSGDAFCNGFLDAATPTAAIDYTAGGGTGTLVISASSPGTDLVLLVLGPDGTIWCSDDFQGSDPLVEVGGAEGGRYTAWVGTFSAQANPVSATLIVSETPPPPMENPFIDDPVVGDEPFSEGTYATLDLSAAPTARLTLDRDEASMAASVSPTMPNPVQGTACSGMIEDAPTVGLTLRGDGPVAITASADTDLVMVLLTPGGTWYCSDDADGFDPGVQIDEPETGTYMVWVGTFGTTDAATDVTVTATRGELEVSGGGIGPEPVPVEPQSEGTYEGTELRTGEPTVTMTAEETTTVRAGGSILNPVEGAACGGFVSERPTAEVEADGAVEVSATADTDLTLIMRTPDGDWYCSDDADGTDPRIRTSGSSTGTYSVWVGTFSRLAEPPEAELSVTTGE